MKMVVHVDLVVHGDLVGFLVLHGNFLFQEVKIVLVVLVVVAVQVVVVVLGVVAVQVVVAVLVVPGENQHHCHQSLEEN